MARLAKAAGCRVSLTTNGELLTPELSKQLVENETDIIAVSFAGASSKTHEKLRRGTDLGRVREHIKCLSTVKRQRRRRAPRLVLSFMMTKRNLQELPDAVHLAKNLGMDELVATNLDCISTTGQDKQKVFGNSPANEHWRDLLERSRRLARKINLGFRSYPLHLEEVVVCELNPLIFVYFSWDGKVSPCAYLGQTKQGKLRRIFCGKEYEISRLVFGDIAQEDFLHIWERKEYRSFRECFARRVELIETAYNEIGADFDLGTLLQIQAARREIQQGLQENPPPEACQTCYKAYGI
jgi:MoaA/NifB/PqqE/SkfB family radical SAM enzyme